MRRRAFQAVTTFTGLAACAAVFAPAAHASSTKADDCMPGQQEWIHVYYPASAHHPTPGCIAGSHSWFSFPGGKKFQELCAGNYSGLIESQNGQETISFWPGNLIIGDLDISWIWISHDYIGKYSCPA
jgi:hypothetical protein